MIRILHSVSNLDRGGIETMLMNYYRRIDRTKIQFDFLCNKPKPGNYDDEVRSLGGRIFISPGLKPTDWPAYNKFMANLLRENPDIKILHAHNECMMQYALKSAKNAGMPIRIAHAHNTKIVKDYKYLWKMCNKPFIPSTATNYFGCGRDAGIWWFGKEKWESSGYTMHNAVDPERFIFDEAVRKQTRESLGISEKFVIGNIGRFNVQKNHIRLIEIFAEVLKIKPDALLMLVGEGELEEACKTKAAELGISDNVMFMGLRSDIPELCKAMDVFVMPSLFEGLPVVGIEAQASGLAALFSKEITDEVVILPESDRLPLSASNKEWAEKIVSYSNISVDRKSALSLVQSSGYDINVEVEKLTELYETFVKNSYKESGEE